MKTRRPTAELLPIAQRIAGMLKDACEQLSIAGSIRRNRATAGDIEIVAVPKITNREHELWALLDEMLLNGDIEKALYGKKQRPKWGEKSRGLMFEDTQVEIYTSYPHSWGYQYWLRTGPSEANEYVMKMRYKKHARFRLKDGEVLTTDGVLHIPTEEDWFRLLGMPYIPAKERSAELYHHYLDAKNHAWGNCFQFLPKASSQTRPLQPSAAQQSLIIYPDFKQSGVWQWESPWVVDDNKVWIELYGRWLIVERDSHRASQYQAFVNKFPRIREENRQELEELLIEPDWDAMGTSSILPNVLDGELAAGARGDKWHGMPSEQQINIDLIVPTQDMVLTRHVKRYWEQYQCAGHMRDADGYLPVAIKFEDDNQYYITNGHHRYSVAKLYNLAFFDCLVDEVPMLADVGIHRFDDADFVMQTDDEDYLADVLLDLVDALEFAYA